MQRKRFLILTGMICSILLVVGLFFMAACAAPTTTPTPEAKTLRIGGLFSLSGWFSPFDLVGVDIAEITRDIINEQGGIVVDGQPYMIELVVEDCQSTFDGVAAACNKLVYDEDIKFIISPSAYFTSPTTPICEPNKVLRVQMFNVLLPDELGPNTPYAFLCNNGAVEHNLGLVDYLKGYQPGIKTVVGLVPEEQMQNVWPLVKKWLNERGINTVGEPVVYSSAETVDWTPIATKCIATGADAVYNTSAIAQHMGPMLKSMREQGSDMFLATVLGCSPVEVMNISGQEAATNFACVGLIPFPPEAPPLMKEIMTRYYDKRGLEAGIHMEPANCLWMLKQAIEKAQSLDTTVVRDTWEKMETFDSPFGTAHLGGLQTYGIKHAVPAPETVGVLEDHEVEWGAWVPVIDP
jgi:branched-chain amino acid transport system substrate-binding protein